MDSYYPRSNEIEVTGQAIFFFVKLSETCMKTKITFWSSFSDLFDQLMTKKDIFTVFV